MTIQRWYVHIYFIQTDKYKHSICMYRLVCYRTEYIHPKISNQCLNEKIFIWNIPRFIILVTTQFFFPPLFQVTLERFDNGPTKDVFYFRIDECGCILCSEVSVSGSPNWHASQLTVITWRFNVPCDKSCDKTVSNKMFEFFLFISLLMFFLIRR